MVFFTCNACGQAIKKAHVEKHYLQQCRSCEVLSCMDCGKDFHGDAYKEHTQCITENEKYGGKGYQASQNVNKGELKQAQWTQRIRDASGSATISPRVKSLLDRVAEYPNVPRKRGKFENFVRNSLKVHDPKVMEQVWNVFSAASEKKESPNTTNGTKAETEVAEMKGEYDDRHVSANDGSSAPGKADVDNCPKPKEDTKKKKEKKNTKEGMCHSQEPVGLKGKSDVKSNMDLNEPSTTEVKGKTKKKKKKKKDESGTSDLSPVAEKRPPIKLTPSNSPEEQPKGSNVTEAPKEVGVKGKKEKGLNKKTKKGDLKQHLQEPVAVSSGSTAESEPKKQSRKRKIDENHEADDGKKKKKTLNKASKGTDKTDLTAEKEKQKKKENNASQSGPSALGNGVQGPTDTNEKKAKRTKKIKQEALSPLANVSEMSKTEMETDTAASGTTIKKKKTVTKQMDRMPTETIVIQFPQNPQDIPLVVTKGSKQLKEEPNSPSSGGADKLKAQPGKKKQAAIDGQRVTSDEVTLPSKGKKRKGHSAVDAQEAESALSSVTNGVSTKASKQQTTSSVTVDSIKGKECIKVISSNTGNVESSIVDCQKSGEEIFVTVMFKRTYDATSLGEQMKEGETSEEPPVKKAKKGKAVMKESPVETSLGGVKDTATFKKQKAGGKKGTSEESGFGTIELKISYEKTGKTKKVKKTKDPKSVTSLTVKRRQDKIIKLKRGSKVEEDHRETSPSKVKPIKKKEKKSKKATASSKIEKEPKSDELPNTATVNGVSNTATIKKVLTSSPETAEVKKKKKKGTSAKQEKDGAAKKTKKVKTQVGTPSDDDFGKSPQNTNSKKKIDKVEEQTLKPKTKQSVKTSSGPKKVDNKKKTKKSTAKSSDNIVGGGVFEELKEKAKKKMDGRVGKNVEDEVQKSTSNTKAKKKGEDKQKEPKGSVDGTTVKAGKKKQSKKKVSGSGDT